MFRLSVLAVSLTIAAGLAGACSSSTSGGDALNQISSAFCARAASCCTGVNPSSCTNDVSNAYKSVGYDSSKEYTSDSVNKCTTAIKGAPCPVGACIFVVPTDCPGQGALLPIFVGAVDGGGEQDSAAADSATQGDASSD